MFEEPRFLLNNFSITFPRQIDIRRKANELEDALKAQPDIQYSQPQVIPVPDDLDPQVPRLLFTSKHGFSHIIISQISVALHVAYSPEWQLEISKGREYLRRRVAVLFELMKTIGEVPPSFAGLTTRVRRPTKAEDTQILEHLSQLFLSSLDAKSAHDIQLKIVEVISERFFSNLTIQNYRAWEAEPTQQGLVPLPRDRASERGIQIVGDLNDRFAFNETQGYHTSADLAQEIIENGLQEIDKMSGKVERISA